MDSRRHFAPGLNRNGERGIPKSGFYSFNFTYECQLDEGTNKECSVLSELVAGTLFLFK